MKLNFNDEDGHLSHNSEEHKKLREKEYDRLAEALRAHLDINAIYDIVNLNKIVTRRNVSIYAYCTAYKIFIKL